MKGGKELGAEYLERIERFLESVPVLPLLPSGAVNMSAIADGANVPRQSLYKNPGIKLKLEQARISAGLKTQHELGPEGILPSANAAATASISIPGKQQQAVERRAQKLEEQNSALIAENAELRRQLRETRLHLGREDMSIDTGRRFPVPPVRS
jgi:hypothetical protein